jgi:hypothetical protein
MRGTTLSHESAAILHHKNEFINPLSSYFDEMPIPVFFCLGDAICFNCRGTAGLVVTESKGQIIASQFVSYSGASAVMVDDGIARPRYVRQLDCDRVGA